MEDEVMQADEVGDATTDDSAGAPAADTEIAAAVDAQAAQSSGADAEQAPEVPDDASATIARAVEHLESVDLDEERESAEALTKRL
jgi:hypothetical protein